MVVLCLVVDALQTATRLKEPCPCGIPREVATLDASDRLGMRSDSLGAVSIDAALANGGTAALVDGDPCLSIGEDIAIQNLPLPFGLNRDSELFSVMDSATTNEWVAVLADAKFRERMGEDFRLFESADSGVAYEHTDIIAIVYSAASNDRIAPFRDLDSGSCL